MRRELSELRPGQSAGVIASGSGGLAAAALTVIAASCCVPALAPLVVGVVGASGAVWAAGLQPYGWWILGVSGVCLGAGFGTAYRPRNVCAVGNERDSSAWLTRAARVSLWVGAVAWIAGVVVQLRLPG